MKKLKTDQNIAGISEQKVIQANADYYNKSAKSYDKIVINKKSHNRLRKSIEYSVRQVSKLKSDIKALDACGGTGNASLILNELGCDTHLVDLSQGMIDAFKILCKKQRNAERTMGCDRHLRMSLVVSALAHAARGRNHLNQPRAVVAQVHWCAGSLARRR